MAMHAGGPRMRLRPLDIGDVLDETFRVYRRQFVALITVMAVVVVPSSLLSLLMVLVTGVGERALERSLSTGVGIAAAAVFFVLVIVAALAQLVAYGAAVRVASDTILGLPVSAAEALRQAVDRFGSLLLASVAVFVPLALLVVTCIGIPVAVFVGLGWSLVFQGVIIEGRGAFGALARSWELVRGHRWRLLLAVFLIGLITALLVTIPAGLFAFVTGMVIAVTGGSQTALAAIQAGNVLFQAVGQTLFGAIAYVTTTILYYDLRVRKEAFDLEQRLLMGEAPADYRPGHGGPPAPGAPPASPPRIPPPPLAPPR